METKDENQRLVAVALQKTAKGGIPKVTASGYGKIAEQILELAFQNGVKVREDKDLAQMLAAVTLESEIPSEVLVAVAEILAYVYKANGTYEAAADDNK
jgi:flagellar biosynthesis protein